MLNFTFQNPTKILFGKGQIAAIAQEMLGAGGDTAALDAMFAGLALQPLDHRATFRDVAQRRIETVAVIDHHNLAQQVLPRRAGALRCRSADRMWWCWTSVSPMATA